MAGPIRIAVLANASQARRELGAVSDQTSTLGSKLGQFGRAAGVAVAAGLAVAAAAAVKFGVDSIKSASDAQQSIGATETVFGKFADTVVKTSNDAAQAYGLSANEYRENANLLGSLFKNQGVALDQLGGSTDKMIGRAADLAATFGGPTSDAVEALGSAFKGEFDSLEKYGVSLKESTVSALLAKRGQDGLTGSALAAAKQQAVTDLIFRQSKDSLGAFGKESDTLAGQQQRLGAQFENIKATVGAALLPVLTRLADFVNSTILPAFSSFIDGIKNGTGAGGTFAEIVTTVAGALASTAGFIKQNSDVIVPLVAGLTAGLVVFKAIMLATKAWAAAQVLLNFALTANPIGIVVVAVAAFVTALVVAYKKSDTFRAVVDAAFRAVKEIVSSVVGWFKKYVPPVFEFVVKAVKGYVEVYKTVVTTVFKAVKAVVTTTVEAIKTVVTTAFNAVKSVVTKVMGAVKDVVSSSWGAVKSAFSTAAGAIKDVVGRIVDSVARLVSAIRTKFNEAVEFVKAIPGRLVSAVGDLGDKLYQKGVDLVNGLVRGVRDAVNTARSEVAALIDSLVPGNQAPGVKLNLGRIVEPSAALPITPGLTAGRVTSRPVTVAPPTTDSSARGEQDTRTLIALAKQQNRLLSDLIQVGAESPIAFGREINGAVAKGQRARRR